MNFRRFCMEIWYEHQAEIEILTGKLPNYDSRHYFNKYKWWLRREYKFRQGKS